MFSLALALLLSLSIQGQEVADIWDRSQHITITHPSSATLDLGCQAASFSGFPSADSSLSLRLHFATPSTACVELSPPNPIYGLDFAVVVTRCR